MRLRESKLDWPYQPAPTQVSWMEWRKFLNSLVSEYGRSGQTKFFNTKHRLGRWRSTTQHWPWVRSGNIIVNQSGEKYDKIQGRYVRSAHKLPESLLPFKVKLRNGIINWVNEEYANNRQSRFDQYKRLKGIFLGDTIKVNLEDKPNLFTAASDGSVKIAEVLQLQPSIRMMEVNR